MTPQEPDREELCLEAERLRACVEMGKLLTSTLKLEEILELIMLKGSQLIDAENWSLLLRDSATGELSFEVVVGLDKELVSGVRLGCGVGIAGQVAETGMPLYLSDVREDVRFNKDIDKRTGFQTESIACIPLKIHGTVLGVIEVINVKDMNSFKKNDLPILRVIAEYAAIAIQNAQYVEKIHEMSITDEYTGLYNARYLHQIVDQLVRTASVQDGAFSVVFVDIDNFKKVVDTYGHLLGSQALKEIGQTIAASLTDSDILVKYGGDEYVIVLPGRDREQAKLLVLEILHKIKKSLYLVSQPEPVRITASFGIASFPDDASTKKDLLLLADQSMYRIKRTSKNGVGVVEH